MNWDLLLIIVFYALLYLYYVKNKQKFTVEHKVFVMYKKKWGIKLMQRIATLFRVPLHWVSYVSIFIGYLGMFAMLGLLIHGTYQLFFVPEAAPVVSPVLPGISLPGLPTLSFWHWIIAILVIAIVHEFSHGIFSKLYGIRVKSSGFAFLGPILAAFVEPDEKQLQKASTFKQLAVLSAGPFSNIVFGFLIILVSLFLFAPVASHVIEYGGVQFATISPESPLSGVVEPGFEVTLVDGVAVDEPQALLDILDSKSPGDSLELSGGNEMYVVTLLEHPEEGDTAYLGVSIASTGRHVAPDVAAKYGSFLPQAFIWFMQLLFWLYVISLGVGLFNLLPLAALDGGRMAYLGALFVTKSK